MNTSRKKLNIKKRFFPQVLPYCLLIISLLVFVTTTITGGLHKTILRFYSSEFDGDPGSDFSQLREAVVYYSTVFQRLRAEGYLFSGSKALCIGSISGYDVIALRQIGVAAAVGVSAAEFTGSQKDDGYYPFSSDSFDFEFLSYQSRFDWLAHPPETASQVCRILKLGGYLVVHIEVKDEYSYNSFVNSFSCCKLVASREIGSRRRLAMPSLREVILKKEGQHSSHSTGSYKCVIPEYKRNLVEKIEALVLEEPRGSWNALDGNENSIQYLPTLVDLSFKERYIYIDLGSRDYNSSIGSWFERDYPKQNKTFEIFAVEADPSFHEEYKSKEGVTLLPYAAWVRNETLFFEIDLKPTEVEQHWEEMGRIQPEQPSSKEKDYVDRVYRLEALDFSDWLIRSVSERDFVVVKMDIEGAEVDLTKRLVETGAICLIDELFLGCHYDLWVKCCSGDRINRYKLDYAQCVSMFERLEKMDIMYISGGDY